MEEENRSNNKSVYCFLCFSFILNLINIILVSIQKSKKQYDDGYFLDLYEN